MNEILDDFLIEMKRKQNIWLYFLFLIIVEITMSTYFRYIWLKYSNINYNGIIQWIHWLIYVVTSNFIAKNFSQINIKKLVISIFTITFLGYLFVSLTFAHGVFFSSDKFYTSIPVHTIWIGTGSWIVMYYVRFKFNKNLFILLGFYIIFLIFILDKVEF